MISNDIYASRPQGSIDGIIPANHVELLPVQVMVVAMFWSNSRATLAKLVKRLRPSGQVALTVQPRMKGANDEDTIRVGSRICEAMRAVGLTDIRTEYLNDISPSAVCVIGRKCDTPD